MNVWERHDFVSFTQCASRMGASWIVEMAFESRNHPLLSIPRAISSTLNCRREACSIANEALCGAVLFGGDEEVRFFMDRVLDLDVPAPLHQQTALNLAVRNGKSNQACLLLDAGADPNCQRSRGARTPLHALACLEGDTGQAMAGTLLTRGAEVTKWDDLHLQPIHLAAMNGQLSLIDLLLENGANVNDRLVPPCLHSPLMFASSVGNVVAVRHLLRAGADVNMRTFRLRETALSIAVRDGIAPRDSPFRGETQAIVRLLLDHGANVELVPRFTRQSGSLLHGWLEVPCESQWDDHHLHAVVQSCLHKGVDADERNEEGRTVLEEVYFRRTTNQILAIPAVISTLLQAGARDQRLIAVCARSDHTPKIALVRHIMRSRGKRADAVESLGALVRACANSEEENRNAQFLLAESTEQVDLARVRNNTVGYGSLNRVCW